MMAKHHHPRRILVTERNPFTTAFGRRQITDVADRHRLRVGLLLSDPPIRFVIRATGDTFIQRPKTVPGWHFGHHKRTSSFAELILARPSPVFRFRRNHDQLIRLRGHLGHTWVRTRISGVKETARFLKNRVRKTSILTGRTTTTSRMKTNPISPLFVNHAGQPRANLVKEERCIRRLDFEAR